MYAYSERIIFYGNVLLTIKIHSVKRAVNTKIVVFIVLVKLKTFAEKIQPESVDE